MRLGELIAALNALVEADEYRADMSIVFGSGCEPGASLEGGIVGKSEAGLAALVLAPVKLDAVGGF